MIDPSKLDLLKGLPSPEEYTRIRRNGESVSADDVIVILESPDDLRRHDELLQHVSNWVFRTQEIRQYNINQDPAGEGVAIAEALELEQQIQKTVRLNLQRVVRTTTGGTLVAAKRVPEPPRNEVDAMKLGRWTGTPLDPENAGCLIEAGQEIASIAPSEKLHAVLYVDQGDRDDLQDEMPLEIKLDHLADITFLTRVDLISPKGEVMAPESLTTRFHGPLATKAKSAGTGATCQHGIPSNRRTALRRRRHATGSTPAEAGNEGEWAIYYFQSNRSVLDVALRLRNVPFSSLASGLQKSPAITRF